MKFGGHFPYLKGRELRPVFLKFGGGDDDDNDSDSGGSGFTGGRGSNLAERPQTSGEQFAAKAGSKIGGALVSSFAGPVAGALASKGIDALTGGPVSVDLRTGARIGGASGPAGQSGSGDNNSQFQTLSGGAQVPVTIDGATGQVIPGAIGGAVSEELIGLRESLAEQQRQFDIGQANVSPFREAGASALQEQQASLGLLGREAQQASFDQFTESPGQAFLRKRGEKALLASASATGALGGGNVLAALQEQGIGFAAQQHNQRQAQLAGISGTGASTAVTQAQLGSQFASDVGQLQQGAAQSRASGLLAQQALEQQQRTAD